MTTLIEYWRAFMWLSFRGRGGFVIAASAPYVLMVLIAGGYWLRGKWEKG